MTRSCWKPKVNYLNIMDIQSELYANNVRKNIVLSEHVGLIIPVSNGTKNISYIKVKKTMINNKYGRLVLTKKKVIHQKKKKK